MDTGVGATERVVPTLQRLPISASTPAVSVQAAGLPEATASESTQRRFLLGLPGVDQVGAEARVAALASHGLAPDRRGAGPVEGGTTWH